MGAIRGILDLKPESERIYEQCQIGKQKKVSAQDEPTLGDHPGSITASHGSYEFYAWREH